MSRMRKTHILSYESCAEMIILYDVTIVSHESINQSQSTDDSQVRSHVKAISQMPS